MSSTPSLDHIGIAVRSIEEKRPVYENLGLVYEGEEVVPTEKVRVAFLATSNTRIELLEPTAEDSPIAKFLAKRGEGIHHICCGVTDLRARMAQLKEQGLRLTSDEPRPGAHGKQVTFLHPASTGGVLLELSQPGEEESP